MKRQKPKQRTPDRCSPGLTGVLVLAVLALAALAGCGEGLPDAVKKEAQVLEKNLDAGKTYINKQKARFKGLAGSRDFSAMAGYAQKEGWEKDFSRASADLDRARKLYDTELAPILKKNDPGGAGPARAQITRITQVIQAARQKAHAPFDRMDQIRRAMTQTRSLVEAARASAKTVHTKIRSLSDGPVAEASQAFPDAVPKIEARFAPLSKLDRETGAHLNRVETEFAAHTGAGSADYAALSLGLLAIDRGLRDLETAAPVLEKDLGQLYQSYTKVLQDMKVDYFVTVMRESWDERSDYYNPGRTAFNVQVSPSVFETLADTPLESIAEITPGFRQLNLKNHIGQAWQELEINPTENWPDRSHNAASFWVEGTRAAYFHKYLMENNGKTEETDWVRVPPLLYEQNLDNLGMAILSKPYGEFEPDPQAAPPGMAYVGNPNYGEWKKDENGDRFWSWYGKYAFFSNLFFFPPLFYSYGSWDRWHKDYRYKKPYYGKTKTGKTVFGTRGTRIKRTPRYQNTTFARTGGFKSRPASVRGAGLRGGGPKGKGK